MKQILLLALILTACSLPNATGDVIHEETTVIGGLFELTGFAAFAGEASRDGFLMAIEDSNVKVMPIVEDGQSNVQTTVLAARKLTSMDDAMVVIGPEWAEFGQAIVPVAEDTQTLFISPWQTQESQWSRSKYYLSGTPSDRSQISAVVSHMKSQDKKFVTVVSTNNEWGISSSELFKSEASKLGLQVKSEYLVEQNTNDFRTLILKISKDNPDAIFATIASDSEQALFNRQLKEQGSNIQIYVPSSRVSPILLSDFANEMQGTLFAVSTPYPGLEEFTIKYETKFGKKPGVISAAVAYDMTTLVLQAIENGATTSEEIREYLMNIKSYEGYSGIIEFNDRGQVVGQQAVMKQIVGGEGVAVS
jgi:branched-chain amino acid transport system substrate-binding protein